MKMIEAFIKRLKKCREQMVRQAHEAITEKNQQESGLATMALVSGFGLFALISVYVE